MGMTARCLGLVITALTAAAILPLSAAQANSTFDTAFVWSGSTTTWQYNHRINRIGSFVQPRGCDASGLCRADLVQTGASGLGPDLARTTAGAHVVSAPGLVARHLTVPLRLTGQRSTEITQTRIATTTVPAGHRAVALLGGYDVLSRSDASKTGSLGFSVGNPVADPAGNVSVPVGATANLGCKTAECAAGAPIDLTVTVSVVVLAARPSRISETQHSLSRSRSWPDGPPTLGLFFDPDQGPYGPELQPVPEQLTFSGKGGKAGLVGLRSIAVRTNGEKHYLALRSQITPRRYTNGRASIDLDLLYKNWAPGMDQTVIPFSLFSFPEAGRADWQLGLSLIELRGRGASVGHTSGGCQITWIGLNLPADGDLAVCRAPVASR